MLDKLDRFFGWFDETQVLKRFQEFNSWATEIESELRLQIEGDALNIVDFRKIKEEVMATRATLTALTSLVEQTETRLDNLAARQSDQSEALSGAVGQVSKIFGEVRDLGAVGANTGAMIANSPEALAGVLTDAPSEVLSEVFSRLDPETARKIKGAGGF